ncbi:MAG: hypothetical protein PVI99_06155 [Anaerolineales bacterium]|jgi:hypothetical protein
MSVKVKKRIITTAAVIPALGILVVVFGIIVFPRAELPALVEEDFCERYHIRFDASSLEQIFLEPESIIADPERFLDEDQAYQLLAEHRARVNDSFPYQAWLKDIEKIASQPEDRRKQRIPFRLYQLISTYKQSFCREVAENVWTYLPDGTDLDVRIYLTAYERSAPAYSRPGEIAISLSHPLFTNPAWIDESTGLSAFFNLGLHEFYHIGFAEVFDPPGEEEMRKNEIVLDVLSVLQNEGVATYISHQMMLDYPTPFEWFVYLVDRESIVRIYLGELNEILEEGSPPPPLGRAYTQIYRRIGSVGYRLKGLNIVGGYMAMKIDEAYGKETLVQTVNEGFFSFAEIYNTTADEEMKIVWEVVP